MTKVIFRLLAAAITIGLLNASAGAKDKLKVVTTFTVIADMASNVAGDAAEVVSITKPGAEIHGYEPTPRDIVRASDADLILWNGMNLELWFEQFLSNFGDLPSVTLTDGIDPISLESVDSSLLLKTPRQPHDGGAQMQAALDALIDSYEAMTDALERRQISVEH